MRAIGAAEAELDADAPDTAYKLLATAEMVNSTTLGVPGWSGFVRASRSPSHAAATLHPLLLHAARRLVPSTPGWRVRPTSMRSPQRSSPGGSIAAVLHNGLGRYEARSPPPNGNANMTIWAYSAGR
ncbi:MAG TPA: hypothetical protein VHS30_04315 [Streptosporangiaceae bacterium]|jgi:hypothetical protein|nr:hypothetical protein [Streptosporangiaceae bacterium]